MSDHPADNFVPPYGKFIGLSHEAALSSEAVDYYNLKSEDPAHLAAWNSTGCGFRWELARLLWWYRNDARAEQRFADLAP
jgi:hypothetical protein